MYRRYFGLKRPPFSIAPDPRYLYMSLQHREALAHLLYGIRSEGGFVLLTGEVGTGKTTVCRRLLETLSGNIAVAFIIHPTLSGTELLAAVCDEFGISYPRKATTKVLVDRINGFLLDLNARRKKAILIIDEAQNLSHDVLEQIRLLTNLETNERKLLQIILIGQPELRDRLARPELRQLSQRIVARCHLEALSKADVIGYVHHRIAVARGRRRRGLGNSLSGKTGGAGSKLPAEPAPDSPREPAAVKGGTGGGAAESGCGDSAACAPVLAAIPATAPRRPAALFSREALNSLYVYSGGIPRLINLICDRALLGAFVQEKESVDGPTLIKAAAEVLGSPLPERNRRWIAALTAAILICVWLGLLYYFSDGFRSPEIPGDQKTEDTSGVLNRLPRPLPGLPSRIHPGGISNNQHRVQPESQEEGTEAQRPNE